MKSVLLFLQHDHPCTNKKTNVNTPLTVTVAVHEPVLLSLHRGIQALQGGEHTHLETQKERERERERERGGGGASERKKDVLSSFPLTLAVVLLLILLEAALVIALFPCHLRHGGLLPHSRDHRPVDCS